MRNNLALNLLVTVDFPIYRTNLICQDQAIALQNISELYSWQINFISIILWKEKRFNSEQYNFTQSNLQWFQPGNLQGAIMILILPLQITCPGKFTNDPVGLAWIASFYDRLPNLF